MKEYNFPNHSGGVLQVVHTGRYGTVPEALLEDRRLGLDSRAVAAWLAIKASGWQINIAYLRWRLALPGKEELGQALWQRIAKELESAGYLCRDRRKGESGLWVWHITFNPVPGSATVDGSAGPRSAIHSAPTCGSPVHRQPGHKPIPRLTLPFKNTTTTNEPSLTPTRKPLRATDFVPSYTDRELHYPTVTHAEHEELEQLISRCNLNARQEILDEIEGIRQGGGIKRGVVPLAKALIGKLAIGEFTSSAGQKVRAQREKRTKHELAIAISVAPIENLLVASEKTIAQLPINLRNRLLAARLSAKDQDST
jgi:hypothetical protein